MSRRINKINDLIRDNISEIIVKQLSLKPGVFVTAGKVDTTSDLSYSRIFISVYPEKESQYILKTLQKEIFRIQGLLNKKMNIKILPRIEFVLDQRQQKIEELDKIFNKIKKEHGNSGQTVSKVRKTA